MPEFFKKKKNLAILISLIFFQMILISVQVPKGAEENYLEKALFMVFAPIQHTVSSFFRKASDLFNGYISLHKVHEKNRTLSEEVSLLRLEKEILTSLLRKYHSEEEIQRLFQNIYENIQIARIIGFDFGYIYSSININKGSLDGVKKDMVVLDHYGCLVGRVIGPVGLKESRVQLITDKESGVSVSSLEKKSIGILSGESGGLCELKYILSTDRELEPGDEIITTGYDGIFPPVVKVGVVFETKETKTLFRKVLVKPYFDIRNLERVAVIEFDVKSFF